jgi:protein O-mannosyl-transferase
MAATGDVIEDGPRLRRRFALALIASVLAAALAIYQRALPFPFSRDDDVHFRMGERWSRPPARLAGHFREDFWGGGEGCGLYRPLTAVTIQATAWWRGLDPLPLRGGNLLLHALVALTAAALARRGGVSRPAALLLALLLAAHPLFSEDVLEVVSRSELQATLGVFAAAALLVGAPAGPRTGICASIGAAVGAALCYLFGLLSKEGATAALPALLALRFAPTGASEGGAAERKARSIAALLLLAALLAVLLLRGEVLGSYVGLDVSKIPTLDNAVVGEPFGVRLLTGVANLGRYLGLVALPIRLSPDYAFAAIAPLRTIADANFVLGTLALFLGGAWLVTAARRGRRVEAFGLLVAGSSWFLVSSIALPIGTLFAERLFHLPACGLLLAAAAALDRGVARRPAARRIAVAAGVLAVAALGARSWVRAGDWRDQLTLYSRALEVVPESARVHCSVGQLLRLSQREADARPHIVRALEILPSYRQACYEAGMLDLDRARVHHDGPALGRAYVWFWLADHAVGATRLDDENLAQVVDAVRQTGLPRSEIVGAARSIAAARPGVPLYERMRRELLPDGG